MIELDECASTQEFPLEKLHEGGIDLESFGQKGGINRGRGSKQGLGDLLSSWKLAAQCSYGHCVAIAHVLLEVHQTFGEHEHVSLLKRFAEQFIGSSIFNPFQCNLSSSTASSLDFTPPCYHTHHTNCKTKPKNRVQSFSWLKT